MAKIAVLGLRQNRLCSMYTWIKLTITVRRASAATPTQLTDRPTTQTTWCMRSSSSIVVATSNVNFHDDASAATLCYLLVVNIDSGINQFHDCIKGGNDGQSYSWEENDRILAHYDRKYNLCSIKLWRENHAIIDQEKVCHEPAGNSRRPKRFKFMI